MADYKLWYFIEGKDIKGKVTISKDMDVDDLRREIHGQSGSGVWGDVDFIELTLLKVDMDRGAKLQAPPGATEMDPMDELSMLWPAKPAKRRIHVCVRLPARLKRAVPESSNIHAQFKRKRLVKDSPSKLATSKNYHSLQRDSDERLLDDRPKPDDIIPIPLLYSGFGHFLDIMDGLYDVPGLADVKVAKLRMAVDAFATNMTQFFDAEHERRDGGLRHLNNIFEARQLDSIPRISPSHVGTVISDGHNLNVAEDGTTSIVVEFKKEQVGNSASPQVELAGYIAHLFSVMNTEVFEQWRVPCLGMTIVGCDVTFYAVLAVDCQVRLVSLTPTISCLESASDGRDRKYLYQAFTAASVLQVQILKDARKLRDTQRRQSDPTAANIPRHVRRFPVISELNVSKYATWTAPGNYLTFEITGSFDDRFHHHLYTAKTSDAKELLIKFTQQYAIELHEFCANQGHAPSILGYERLPGGWFGVAMEWIKPGMSVIQCDSDFLKHHRDRWTKELEHLVSGFHAVGLVHGDLRDANIICKDESIMLVDFDWGGKVGEASYPTLDLNHELVDGRGSEDLHIRKDDDMRVLAKTLSKLR